MAAGTDIREPVSPKDTIEIRGPRWPRMLVWMLALGAFTALIGWRIYASSVAPLSEGSSVTPIKCSPATRTLEVPDFFGGGGDVVAFRDGARCSYSFSVRNPHRFPVTVTDVGLTDPETIQAITWTEVTRAPGSLEDTSCFGCPHVPFTPMTIDPGEEWEIKLTGEMSGCIAPTGSLSAAGVSPLTAHPLSASFLGVQRELEVPLAFPYGVAWDECPGP